MAYITGAYLIQLPTGRQIRSVPSDDRLLFGPVEDPAAMVAALPFVSVQLQKSELQIVSGPIADGIGPAPLFKPQVWAQTEPTPDCGEVFCRAEGTVVAPDRWLPDSKHQGVKHYRYIYLATLKALPQNGTQPRYRFTVVEWFVSNSSQRGITLRGRYHTDLSLTQAGLAAQCPQRWQAALQACFEQMSCPDPTCYLTHVPISQAAS